MDLFMDFRDRKLNYKQLVAENMARRGLKTNKLVQDLMEKLNIESEEETKKQE